MTKYFVIPFAYVPPNPTYQVWFASWSETRPIQEPGHLPPFVVGAMTTDDRLPAGATLLAETATKDPVPPPPPLAGGAPSDYQVAFNKWLTSIMEE